MSSGFPKFAMALGELAVMHGIEINDARITLYWGALKDLDHNAVLAALSELRRTAVHFPKVPEIRKLIEDQGELVAVEKWGEVLRLLRDSRNAKHTDPLVEAVIREMGGWVYLGTEVDLDSLHTWKAKEFRELYAQIADREHTAQLIGAPDLNSPAGQMVSKVAAKLGGGE